jgi:hypothetical protein
VVVVNVVSSESNPAGAGMEGFKWEDRKWVWSGGGGREFEAGPDGDRWNLRVGGSERERGGRVASASEVTHKRGSAFARETGEGQKVCPP